MPRPTGTEQLATVDDVDAYRKSVAASTGRDAATRIAWCESSIRVTALATIVTNPRATVNLQSAMARRAGVPGASSLPSAADSPPRSGEDAGSA